MTQNIILLALPAAEEQFFTAALLPLYTCRAAHTLRAALQQVQLYAPCLIFAWGEALTPADAAALLQTDIPAVQLGGKQHLHNRLDAPFTLPRVLQSVNMYAARAQGGVQSCRVNGYTVDFIARTAQKGQQTLPLTPQQTSALLCLAQARGQAVGQAALIKAVWGSPAAADAAALRREIAALRALLGHNAVRTCPGQGYALGTVN